MSTAINQFVQALGSYLPSALAALAILIGGWLVALIGAGVTRNVLQRTGADRWLGSLLGESEERIHVARWVSRLVYYLIMLFVIVGVLQALNLAIVAEPINRLLGQVLAYVPLILGAVALLLVAWLGATALRYLLLRVFNRIRLDERLSSQADLEAGGVPVSVTISNVVYWLVFLLFLPAVLGALGLQGLLQPVQNMVDEILGVLPDIIGAGLILVVGWFAARIVRQVAANLMTGIGVDGWGERSGVAAALGEQKLSQVIATIVYVLILIPVIIGALNALGIEAVSSPAAQMLTTLLNALPAIFGAFLLIGVAYFIARVVGGFVTNVLTGIGFDRVLTWVGLGQATRGQQTPSQIVGYLTTVAIMLFAIIEAADMLGFTILSELISEFLVAAGSVLLALVIFGLGLYLASLAERVIRSAGGPQSSLLATTARVAILVFAGALALRQTGIGQDIVTLAFGILLGTVAVAAAIAFGLGARDLAGEELARWIESRRGRGG